MIEAENHGLRIGWVLPEGVRMRVRATAHRIARRIQIFEPVSIWGDPQKIYKIFKSLPVSIEGLRKKVDHARHSCDLSFMTQYIALVHKDEDSAYGVTFPDLPGCFSASDDLEHVIPNAIEALGLWFDDHDEVAPSSMDKIAAEAAAEAWLVAVPFRQATERPSGAYEKIAAGLEDAIAFTRGDIARARVSGSSVKLAVYPSILERAANGFSVFFPDLPGCVSAGDTISETVSNAKDALSGHLELTLAANKVAPAPSRFDAIERDPEVEEVARLLIHTIVIGADA